MRLFYILFENATKLVNCVFGIQIIYLTIKYTVFKMFHNTVGK